MIGTGNKKNTESSSNKFQTNNFYNDDCKIFLLPKVNQVIATIAEHIYVPINTISS